MAYVDVGSIVDAVQAAVQAARTPTSTAYPSGATVRDHTTQPTLSPALLPQTLQQQNVQVRVWPLFLIPIAGFALLAFLAHRQKIKS